MELQIRKGNCGDTEQLVRFLQEVKDGMQNPEWFYLDPPEAVRKMMADGTMELWVAVDGDKIVAAVDFLRPGLVACNYGYDLNFSEADLLRVINMDNVAVHPDYRGRGLQRILIDRAEKQLREEGNYILLCTVHPDNHFSLRNVLAQGYQIRKKTAKYGSVRYVLQKNI